MNTARAGHRPAPTNGGDPPLSGVWVAGEGDFAAGSHWASAAVEGGFIVDFACPQLSLAIEVDGSQHDEGRSRDDWRSEKLGEEGYRVLRFWNSEVFENLDGVLEVIYAAMEEGERRWG